ncbi:MAG: hypothetical protein J5761_00545 [Paludibacteraceae bacterium]|nr:hypothetical protein [Paludibacteraceae bacterium]
MDLANIMYRHYDNRYSISVPGIPTGKVSVDAEGASARFNTGVWLITPDSVAKIVTVTVYADINGQKKTMGIKKFRVLELPPLQAYLQVGKHVYSNNNSVSKSVLLDESATITPSFGPNCPLMPPTCKIESFIANINGQMLQSTGSQLSEFQREQIQSLKKGSRVIITDIRANLPNGELLRLAPLSLILN